MGIAAALIFMLVVGRVSGEWNEVFGLFSFINQGKYYYKIYFLIQVFYAKDQHWANNCS